MKDIRGECEGEFEEKFEEKFGFFHKFWATFPCFLSNLDYNG